MTASYTQTSLASRIETLRQKARKIEALAKLELEDAEGALEEARRNLDEAEAESLDLFEQADDLEARALEDPSFEELHDARHDPRQLRMVSDR